METGQYHVLFLMKRDGRNFNQCELCPAAIPEGEYEIHHTKYEGATYFDLWIVCRTCNRNSENCLLD
jgi:hypothetical protein